MAYKGHRIVDLTQDLYEGQPVFIGHPETKVWNCMTHEESVASGRFGGEMSYTAKVLQICEHGPTHIDSISHIDPRPDAMTIDKMGLDFFYNEGICIDLSDTKPRTSISRERLEQELEKTDLDIPNGGTLLYHLGHYNRHYPSPEYSTQYGGLSLEAAEFAYVEKGALNVGTDAPSIDNAADNTFPCHSVICRNYQRTNTENLCNLENLAGQRFLFIGLPLKIREGTGSPIRAVAVLGA